MSDNPRPPAIDDGDPDGVNAYLEELFDQAEAHDEMMRTVEQLRRQGALRISETGDFRVERIVNPSVAAATEIADRHEWLNRSADLALAGRQAFQGNPIPLQALGVSLPLKGAFLERQGYTIPAIQEKIEKPDEYVIVHSGGVIRDGLSLRLKPFAWVSDIQFQLAKDDAGAPLIAGVPHPDERERFHPAHQELARKLAERIHENHARVGVVTDVCVYPEEYRDHRFASRARRHVAKVVHEQVNPNRKTPVDVWLASMFRIEAIRAADGRRIVLPEPIINNVSIIRHTLSTHFRAFLGWRVPATDIEVQIIPPGETEAETYYIETGWETAVMQPGPEA